MNTWTMTLTRKELEILKEATDCAVSESTGEGLKELLDMNERIKAALRWLEPLTEQPAEPVFPGKES